MTKIAYFQEYAYMVKIIISLICLALLVTGCAYSVFSNAYPHLKKIRIAAFDNKSTEFDLGEKSLNMLSSAFRDDGRLRPVTQSPDCLLEGSVTSFEEKIYSFDSANNVQDYQIRIGFKISLTDLINNQTIYENNALVISELYAVSTESSAKFNNREDAIDEIINNLFKNIIQNSLENW